MQEGNTNKVREENQSLIHKIYGDTDVHYSSGIEEPTMMIIPHEKNSTAHKNYDFVEEIQEEEPISLQDKELELIQKALERNKGKRKEAARELGISERTLYRKIKQYDLE